MAVSIGISITQNSQNIANNTSNVTTKVTGYWTYGSWNHYTTSGTCTINGTPYGFSLNNFNPNRTTSGSMTLFSKALNISHATDGKKTLSVSAVYKTGLNSVGNVSASASKVLTTIPRATTPTVSESSVDMGDKVTINTPRAASSFTHDLAYAFAGEDYKSIATGVGTSYSWTVPDLASKIPKATSGTVTIRCITKDSSDKTIGTKTVTLTAKVPSEVIPTVSGVTHAEATSGLAAQFGAYIQNKSKLAIKITAAGAKGSSITDYQAKLNGKTYDDASFTSAVLTSSGELTLQVRVKDSRGRWSAYKNVDINVLAYSSPKIQALKVYRCDASGNPDDEGTYMAVEYRYSVTSLGGKNTASMAVKYKRSTATEYTNLLTNTALSANTTAKPTTVFSTDYQFDVQMTVTDWFGATATANAKLPTAAVIMDLKADGLGISFGKVSEFAGIEFGWDIVGTIARFGSMNGVYRTHDDLLVQWGLVSITPEAADTPTSVLVDYPEEFAATPVVLTSLATSVPHTVSVGIQRTASLVPDVKKGIALTLVRSNTTSTGVYWLAIGKGAA